MTRLLIIGIAAVGMNAGVALAQEDNMSGHDAMKGHEASGHEMSMKMTPELKKDMADMYQKMADCMRSDKSVEECSHDAMTNCPVVAKTGHCPINEGMGAMTGKKMKHPKGGMGMGNMKNDHSGMDMSNMKDNHPMSEGQ